MHFQCIVAKRAPERSGRRPRGQIPPFLCFYLESDLRLLLVARRLIRRKPRVFEDASASVMRWSGAGTSRGLRGIFDAPE